MLFSSISFLYYFLPIVIAVYFLVPNKIKNLVLLTASLFFYFWGEPIYTLLMLFTAFSGYLHGILIEKFRGRKASKFFMVSSIVISVLLLGIFKYSDFFIENVNMLFNSSFALLGLALPIGISFYTFQTLSYTIDVYRGQAQVQKNFINFATYVSLFPQLIAGPIVRYVTVQNELDNRKHSFEKVSSGITRFIIGLSKKILVANILGEFCEIFKSSLDVSTTFVWAYAIAYTLHIYFDFSGYSDMAIGLGKIFGFNFPENFNYPYISSSITEFWRRWHISLSTWFRDYVYIPLGGNRVSKLKWIRNIFVVWALTGFWHGAGWTFIIWGLMFAVLLIIEKTLLRNWLERIPKVFSRIYTLVLVIISFVIFDAETISVAFGRIKSMFGFGGLPLITSDTLYYVDSYLIIFIIAILGATPLVKKLVNKVKNTTTGNSIINVLEPIFNIVLLLVCTAYLIDGSFNPFLYFRF